MPLSDEIKQRLDIVAVVSRYVALKKAGRSYRAPCPFHSEKTPSFFVFPERQNWHCFGACATGGDVFSFVMKAEGKEFGEVLKTLAQEAGVSLPQLRRSDSGPILSMNDAACAYYQEVLLSSEGTHALAYLEGRGVSRETIDRFRLGFSPRSGHSMARHLQGVGFTKEQLASAGLVTVGEDGSMRDLFRSRVMFPIKDAHGNVVGFGGRALDDSTPKYLNTPRTGAFDKGHLLYALDLARETIRQSGEAVIVEGYMDALMTHQYGFSNVVASMGTALTEHQVGLLQGLASNFVLALDPDVAGQEATLRSLESSWHAFERRVLLKQHGLTLYEKPRAANLRVAALPAGKDPDEVVKEDAQEWRRCISEAEPITDFFFKTMTSKFDLSTSQGKSEAASRVFPLIAAMDNPFEQDRAFRRLAQLLGVSEATLEASVGRPQVSPRTPVRRPRTKVAEDSPFSAADHDLLEEYCLTLLFQHPELKEQANKLSEEHFNRAENRGVFTAWIKCSNIEMLLDQLQGELREYVEYLRSRQLPPMERGEWGVAFVSCARRLEERHLRELKAQEELALSEVQEEQGRTEVLSDLQSQIVDINERLKRLFQEKV